MTVGIWRPVELLLIDTVRITNVLVTPLEFLANDVRVGVELELECVGKGRSIASVSGRVHDAAWNAAVTLQPGATL